MQNKSNTDLSQNGYYLMKNIRQLSCKKNCFGLTEHGSMEKYLKITADFFNIKKNHNKILFKFLESLWFGGKITEERYSGDSWYFE